MSLEAVIEAQNAALVENTNVMRDLIAALLATGKPEIAPGVRIIDTSVSPAVKAVVKAQKELEAKKSDKKEAEPTPEPTSGEASTEAPATESASVDAGELAPWADKTAELHAKLKDLDPNFANLKEAVLGINRIVGREQAEAVLSRFGAQAITAKADKKGLDENQYPAVYEMCIGVLAGRVDATASME
ncbi:hypothetical protein AWB74_02113 [Caballeronia arvi]|uniref:Uncharacterized protein n=1 Tax=Caballeronia arvi TaxID=1777135 RepID=A0A158HS68_9BURK|nr:hypothetical protein [Caballeronia arvi]SAL47208.1 hypothetical protein AWB74_02113 [Caballeronia arvi]